MSQHPTTSWFTRCFKGIAGDKVSPVQLPMKCWDFQTDDSHKNKNHPIVTSHFFPSLYQKCKAVVLSERATWALDRACMSHFILHESQSITVPWKCSFTHYAPFIWFIGQGKWSTWFQKEKKKSSIQHHNVTSGSGPNSSCHSLPLKADDTQWVLLTWRFYVLLCTSWSSSNPCCGWRLSCMLDRDYWSVPII